MCVCVCLCEARCWMLMRLKASVLLYLTAPRRLQHVCACVCVCSCPQPSCGGLSGFRSEHILPVGRIILKAAESAGGCSVERLVSLKASAWSVWRAEPTLRPSALPLMMRLVKYGLNCGLHVRPTLFLSVLLSEKYCCSITTCSADGLC